MMLWVMSLDIIRYQGIKVTSPVVYYLNYTFNTAGDSAVWKK